TTNDPSSDLVANVYVSSCRTRNDPDQVVLKVGGGRRAQAATMDAVDGAGSSRVRTAVELQSGVAKSLAVSPRGSAARRSVTTSTALRAASTSAPAATVRVADRAGVAFTGLSMYQICFDRLVVAMVSCRHAHHTLARRSHGIHAVGGASVRRAVHDGDALV